MDIQADHAYPPRPWFLRYSKIILVLSFICIVPLWTTASWYYLSVDLQRQLHNQTENALQLFADSLTAEIETYRFIPKVLIGDQLLIQALAEPDQVVSAELLSHLEHIHRTTQSDEVFLIDADGIALASTRSENIGTTYKHSPFYQDAMMMRSGGFFTLDLHNGVRGYYFSEPIAHPQTQQVIGAVVLKVNMARLERNWLNQDALIVVTDPFGVVISSSVPAWLFTVRQALSEAQLQLIQLQKKYPIESFILLETQAHQSLSGIKMVSLPVADKGKLIEVQLDLEEVDWRLYGYGDWQTMANPLQRRVALSMLICILTLALVYAFLHRRASLQETMARRQVNEIRLRRSKDLLEDRVKERTRELKQSNDKLLRTQQELIHTAKMATLGQLATSVSHELNQPLAGVQATADNALQWLQQDRKDKVENNLSTILRLTKNMASITSHLKTFGYRSDDATCWVRALEVIDNARALIALKLPPEQLSIELNIPSQLYVRANLVRLEQVFINLLVNAVEAMDGMPVKRIKIDAVIQDENVALSVADEGTGIEITDIEHLFDPFFTTKDVGMGLGLGLSTSYSIVQAMGGSLTAANREQGGAIFTVQLPAKEQI